jgi:hypothetical protein
MKYIFGEGGEEGNYYIAIPPPPPQTNNHLSPHTMEHKKKTNKSNY